MDYLLNQREAEKKKEIHFSKTEEKININRDKSRMTRDSYKYQIKKMKDSASLGSTSWKENTEYKKKRNRNIRQARQLTSKATAYTLELFEQCKNINKTEFGKMDTEDLIMSLDCVKFTEDMFFSDTILKNFTYYMKLVQAWKTLSNRKKDGELEYPDDPRLSELTPVMDLFSKRMQAFCNANRLTLSGKIMESRAEGLKMTRTELLSWYNLAGTREKEKAEQDEEDTLEDCTLTSEQITELLQEKDDAETEAEQSPLALSTATDRIQRLHNLKKSYEQFKKLRMDFENETYLSRHPLQSMKASAKGEPADKDEEFDDLQEHTEKKSALLDFEDEDIEINALNAEMQAEARGMPVPEQKKEDKALYYAKLTQLKKDETEARAVYLLAYKEALYQRAKLDNDPMAEQYRKSFVEIREDVRRIRDRHIKEELKGGEGPCPMSRSVRKISRAEAINTHSDRLSYQSRRKLIKIEADLWKKINRALSSQRLQRAEAKQLRELKQVMDKLHAYAINTRYKVGYNKETDNLRSGIKALDAYMDKYGQQSRFSAEIAAIKGYLNNLTMGNLNTQQIPPGKLRDFHNRRPVEGGEHTRGWKRNGILTSFSHWSDKRDTPLFSHEPTVNDLKQRMVSNCYMVSSVATLCELSPDYIKNMMKDNGDGTVTVRLYVEKEENNKTEDTERMTLLHDINQYDYEKNTAPENRDKRLEQLVCAAVNINRQRELGKPDVDVSGLTETTAELLNYFGEKTKSYSLAQKMMEDLGSKVPELEEYLKSGTIGGAPSEDIAELSRKVWTALLNYSGKDPEGLNDFLDTHRKETELEAMRMEEVFVRVDKEVPRLFNSDLLSAGALWMQMIEKAAASLGKVKMGNRRTTGYRSLWYGEGSEVIRMLTGSNGTRIPVDDDLFLKICRWREDNAVYTTGTKNTTSDGLESGHAYSILGGFEVNGEKYVKLRNPYGQGSGSYDYGKSEDAFEKNNSLNFIGGSDETYGQFDIKWEDFKKDFKIVCVNNMNGFGGKS